jgi:hypothetical protein
MPPDRDVYLLCVPEIFIFKSLNLILAKRRTRYVSLTCASAINIHVEKHCLSICRRANSTYRAVGSKLNENPNLNLLYARFSEKEQEMKTEIWNGKLIFRKICHRHCRLLAARSCHWHMYRSLNVTKGDFEFQFRELIVFPKFVSSWLVSH